MLRRLYVRTETELILKSRRGKGHGPIREFFRALIKEFAQPGTMFSMRLQSVDGDFWYALWSAETADNVYEMATDTHVVRDGKIVAQSFAGQITPRR